MTEFLESTWGYSFQIPDHWLERNKKGVRWFFPNRFASQKPSMEMSQGYLIVRPDWIFDRQDIEVLWQRHVGTTAGMVGAKNVGSAPLRIREAQGLEADIILPKKENKRLWLAILRQGPIVMNMVVEHHLKDRDWFEPEVSAVIASLRFVEHINGLQTGKNSFPLPDEYRPIDPRRVIADIPDPSQWHGYTGPLTIGGLQAFYFRECAQFGWNIKGYTPFPSKESDLGIARFQLEKEGKLCTLGIVPAAAITQDLYMPAHIILKWG